jgi:hypothetical protein
MKGTRVIHNETLIVLVRADRSTCYKMRDQERLTECSRRDAANLLRAARRARQTGERQRVVMEGAPARL